MIFKILKTKNPQIFGKYLLFKEHNFIIKRLINKFNSQLFSLKLKFFGLHGSDINLKIKSIRQKNGLDYYSHPVTSCDITTTDSYKKCDIINLHWVAGMLDYYSFFRKNTKPVVWTLHDMSPLLGGEHYAEWYSEINEAGEPGIRIYSKDELDLEYKLASFKRKILSNNPLLHFVCPSKWLFEEVVKSGICDSSRIFHIPYGINTEVFRPIDAENYRHSLGIEPEWKVVLFVADSLNNRRKGIVYLLRALQGIETEITLISVGSGEIEHEMPDNIKYISLGRIEDESLMAKIYSAANLFVIPSLMDNLPNTVIESLCCGTPVVGFPVGGINDMVNNTNGILAGNISVNALKTAIRMALDRDGFFDRKRIAADAHGKYNLNIQAEQYLKLFQRITHGTHAN